MYETGVGRVNNRLRRNIVVVCIANARIDALNKFGNLENANGDGWNIQRWLNDIFVCDL